MRIGSVVAPGPVVKLAITRSSSESVKASIQADASAGAINGGVTVRKVLSGGQPRSIAASSRLASKLMSRDCTTTVAKQAVTVVWAIAMVQKPRSTPTATNISSSESPVNAPTKKPRSSRGFSGLEVQGGDRELIKGETRCALPSLRTKRL